VKPLHAALDRIGVEESERPLFLWAGLSLGFTGAAAFALLNTAEALFLKRIGVAYLPLVLLASSALLVLTTTGVGAVLARGDRPRWLPRLLLLLAALLVPFTPLIAADVPRISAVLVLAARQVLALSIMCFWQALNDLVTARQAKRLFAPLASGITIGGIVGSFASAPISRVVGLEGVPLVCAGMLAAASFAARRLRAAQPRRLDRSMGAPAVHPVAPVGGFADLWRESTLFRLLVVTLFCGGLLGPALYYQFSFVADAATSGPEGEQRLLDLFAQFRGWLNVAMLGTQLWLSGHLYRRLGLPLALAFWPAAYLMGFAWLGVQPVLLAAVAGLGAARLTEDGIAGSALRVIFNLFPDHLRSRAAGLLEGPINRLGGVLGNALVMIALALGAGAWIGYGALPIAAVWLGAALSLRRAYPSLLLQASAERSLVAAGADRAQLLDPATLRALAPHLAATDPSECRAAIDLVTSAPPELVVAPLARAVEAAPAQTRAIVIDALHRTVEPLAPGALRDPDAAEVLARLLLEGELLPEQRADLLQVYARLTGGPDASPEETRASERVLRRTMGDRQAAVRLASIAELVRRGQPPPGVPDLDTALDGALGGRGRDVLMRRTARKELRAMLLSSAPDPTWTARLQLLASRLEPRADRAETAEALVEVARRHGAATAACADAVLRWADDPDPRVRAAVLAFAGDAGLADQAPRLARALGSRQPEEAAAAHEGLVALGAEAALKPVLEQGFGSTAQRDAALAVLAELEVDAGVLEAVFQEQLTAGLEAVVLRGALGEPAPAPLLARRLEERIAEALGSLLALLAVLRDEPRIGELEARLRRTRDERRRDVLVEALESLLGTQDRLDLAPLLDPAPWGDRAARASDRLGRRLPTASVAWAELQRDRDELTRGLALASRPVEPGEAIGDATPVPDSMSLAVRLQGVPAFDRLATRELVRMAEALEAERRPDGEAIFEEGDEGACLYFVLSGEVELAKNGVAVDRVGADRFFGEISTLDGVPRAVSARATGPVELLRLDRADLLALMEDSPALGIGLSQHLALRVRELQERLRESG